MARAGDPKKMMSTRIAWLETKPFGGLFGIVSSFWATLKTNSTAAGILTVLFWEQEGRFLGAKRPAFGALQLHLETYPKDLLGFVAL